MSRHAPGRPVPDDLVPLPQRVRALLLWRVAAVGLLLAWAQLSAGSGPLPPVAGLPVATLLGVYGTAVVGVHAVWLLSRRIAPRSLVVRWTVSTSLLVDGLLLALVATGGQLAGSARFLVLTHVLVVTLLASFRTGAKLAAWHGLLAFSAAYAQEAALLPVAAGQDPTFGEGAFRSLLLQVAGLMVVMLITASAAAVNERELRRRRWDLEALARFARALDEHGDADAVGRTLAAAVVADLDVPRAVCTAMRSEPQTLLVHARAGTPAARDGHTRATGPATRHATVAAVTTLGRSAGSQAQLVARSPEVEELLPGAGRAVVVPVAVADGVEGLLVVEHAGRTGPRVERRVVTMLERYAAHGALSMRSALLVAQLRQQAEVDGLTGVATRRVMDRALETHVAATAAGVGPTALLLVDIDHFKRVNDTHGHQVGDQVLRRVAQVLARACRAQDVVARFGGEEFAVVLPGADLPVAAAVYDAIRAALASAEVAVTVSAGAAVAVPGEADAGVDELLRRADANLYAAKRAGRDQLCTHLRLTATGTARGADTPQDWTV